MLGPTVPAALARFTRIAADRAVSTTSLRFVQGLAPEIERKLSQGEGRTEAYVNRDQVYEKTGLSASSVLPEYYPRQVVEVGIIFLSRKGQFGLVEVGEDTWRGQASGWVLDWDAYTPQDIPVLDLETEDYVLDVDTDALLASMAPTTSDWAKNHEAHRLVLALLYHAGLKKVRLTTKLVAEVMGKSRFTAVRLIHRLEKLGFLVDGWMDLSPLLVDATAVLADQEHAEVVRLAGVRRWSVFTREGWEVAGYAKQWMEMLKTVPEEEVQVAHWTGLTNGWIRAVDYVREVLSRPNATGRRVDPHAVM